MKRRSHSSKILQFAADLASRESGFIFALVGVFVQASHTWFISYELSSFTGFLRLAQAGLMAFFLSAALLYFTLKSSDEDTDIAKRYRTIVWWFAIIECVINLYYWAQHLVVEPWPNAEWSKFIIAVPFSILLPFTLKAYSSEVRTDDFSEEDDELVDPAFEDKIDISNEAYKDMIDDIIDSRFMKFIETLETAEPEDEAEPVETTEPAEPVEQVENLEPAEPAAEAENDIVEELLEIRKSEVEPKFAEAEPVESAESRLEEVEQAAPAAPAEPAEQEDEAEPAESVETVEDTTSEEQQLYQYMQQNNL